MQVENGVIPVELQCGAASVTMPGTLDQFSCTLRNNTAKNIVAANVAYTIQFEQEGRLFKDFRSHVIASSVHPDFYDEEKPIKPGGTTTVRPAGAITYENAVVKGLDIRVSYVEFSDHTSVELSEDGAQPVEDLRAGAARYKSWLVEKYKKGSIDAVIELLQAEPPLTDLGLTNGYQQQGAILYRRRLQKINKARGRTQVQQYLSK
jgi:hypothetical protein